MKSKSCSPAFPARQSGSMLLEALIAILVFSLGILTVIGIQAASVKMAADAQLRTKAALLADRLVGEMWVDGGDIASLKTKFGNGGVAYNIWLTDVKKFTPDGPGLPDVREGAGECPSTLPDVTVVDTPGEEFGRVAITLYWRTPSMPDCERHTHTVTTQIARNP